MFSISVPFATAPVTASAPAMAAPRRDTSLSGLRVLCVDNDTDILAGMQALLERWHAVAVCATTIDGALAKMKEAPQVLLVDYHLHDRLDGLAALDALRAGNPGLPGALLTADGSDELKRRARERGYVVLTKPVKPASLRAFLAAHAGAG
jgi:CheY-like chemotaxis protein